MSRPCSGCVHGRLYVTRQQEHSYVLSPPRRDTQQLLCGCTGAGRAPRIARSLLARTSCPSVLED